MKRPVRIVTDSTADLPPALATALDIATVPIAVHFGQHTLEDGGPAGLPAFLERAARDPHPPTTSAPPPAAFVALYSRLLAEGFDILSVHLASALSSTVERAREVAGRLAPDRIAVVDSGQLTMGLGLLAAACARAARAGAGLAELVAHARRLVPCLRLAGVLTDLDFVRRGGRIHHLTALLGGLLHIRPVFAVREGDVRIAARARTAPRALDRLVELVRQWGPADELAIMHTGDPSLADALAQRLAQAGLGPAPPIYPAGAVVACHVGPGAVGVAARLAEPVPAA